MCVCFIACFVSGLQGGPLFSPSTFSFLNFFFEFKIKDRKELLLFHLLFHLPVPGIFCVSHDQDWRIYKMDSRIKVASVYLGATSI